MKLPDMKTSLRRSSQKAVRNHPGIGKESLGTTGAYVFTPLRETPWSERVSTTVSCRATLPTRFDSLSRNKRYFPFLKIVFRIAFPYIVASTPSPNSSISSVVSSILKMCVSPSISFEKVRIPFLRRGKASANSSLVRL